MTKPFYTNQAGSDVNPRYHPDATYSLSAASWKPRERNESAVGTEWVRLRPVHVTAVEELGDTGARKLQVFFRCGGDGVCYLIVDDACFFGSGRHLSTYHPNGTRQPRGGNGDLHAKRHTNGYDNAHSDDHADYDPYHNAVKATNEYPTPYKNAKHNTR